MKKTDRCIIKSTYIDFIINRVNPVEVHLIILLQIHNFDT